MSIIEFVSRVRRSIRRRYFGHPDLLVLQAVSACNLQCEHCFINDYGKTIPDGKIKILPLAEVERRLQLLKPIVKSVSAISFSSFEALLHRDFFKLLDAALAINPRLAFSFLSNGQLITPEIVQKLENYKLTNITISLDGLNATTVEAFKTGAKFEKTIAAIKLFCESKHREKVEVVFVAHRNNIIELPDYIDYVATLGVTQVQVSNLLTFREELQRLALYSPIEDETVRDIFSEATRRAQKHGIALGLPRLTPKAMGCTAAEIYFVDIEGHVSPCDFLAVQTPFYFMGKKRTVRPVRFGNALEQNPFSIWNSQEAKEFRFAHRKGKIPPPCSHCIDAYGLMCSKREKK